MFGLSEKIYNQILNVIKKYNYNFVLFGSRARGDYKNNSDIDIAILDKIDDKTAYQIKNEFDMLNIPYTIDIIFIEKGIKEELKKSIEKEGVKL